MPSCRLFQQPSNHHYYLQLSSKKSNGLLSCVTRSSSSKQFQIGNKRYQVGPIDLKLFFLTQKIHFPTAGHDVHWAFLYRSRRRHRHILHSLLVIRTKKSFISSTFFQRPINPMPINSSNKKPTQDIRFTIVFPRFFPTKLTIVMLIGIRHCQVSTNYCDNDCMFVMFISSSNEETGEKYA